MSELDTSSNTQLPDLNSPIFKVLREISTATSPEMIIQTLQKAAPLQADYIGLVRADFSGGDSLSVEVIAEWSQSGKVPAQDSSDIIRAVGDQDQLIIDDIKESRADDPLRRYVEENLESMSLAAFPLRGRDQIVGYIILANKDVHHYSEAEIHFIIILSGQIASSLENISLMDALSRQTERLGLVNQLAQAVTGTVDIATLRELLVPSLSHTLPMAHLSMVIDDSDLQKNEIENLYGVELVAGMVGKGSYIWEVLDGGITIHITDLGAESGDEGGQADLWISEGIHSLAILPMIARNERIGTLNIGGPKPKSFDATDMLMFEQLSSQLAVALENIRLFDRLQSSLEETTALYSTALAMNAAQSVEEVYDTALTEIENLSKADRLTLYLAGPNPRGTIEYLEAVAVLENGVISSGEETPRYAITEAPVLSQFPQSRANLTFNDVRNDRRLDKKLRDNYESQGVDSLMMIPLSTGTIWLGAILAEGKRNQSYSGDQVQLCRNMADQAALAIDSHLLLSLTQQSVQREQVLRQIIEKIRDSDEVDSVLDISADELSRILSLSAEDLRESEFKPEKLSEQSLTSEELELIETVADQIALAVDNINLINSIQGSITREHIISTVTAQIQRSSSVDDVLAAAVASIDSVLEGYDISLRLTPDVSALEEVVQDTVDD